jgi:hypothetical protein
MEIQGVAAQASAAVETQVRVATGQDQLTIAAQGPLTASPGSAAPGDGHDKGPVTAAVAKLLGQGDAQVSYRVYRNPDEIVTVFSDPNTGAEIAQFPSKAMVQIAEMFDAQAGVTLDQNA